MIRAAAFEQARDHNCIPPSSGAETVFIPLNMLAGNPLGHRYAALVREYDPSREVVVIFMRPPGSVSAYKGAVPGRETPPEAHRWLDAILFGER